MSFLVMNHSAFYFQYGKTNQVYFDDNIFVLSYKFLNVEIKEQLYNV